MYMIGFITGSYIIIMLCVVIMLMAIATLILLLFIVINKTLSIEIVISWLNMHAVIPAH